MFTGSITIVPDKINVIAVSQGRFILNMIDAEGNVVIAQLTGIQAAGLEDAIRDAIRLPHGTTYINLEHKP